MLCNERFDSFISSSLNEADYMFIDPPWNYRPSMFGSAVFWHNVSFVDLFQQIKAPNIFMWVTLEALPAMIAGHIESSYELRALIPYVRVGNHEDIMYSLKQGFKYPLQYLAVFQTRNSTMSSQFSKLLLIENDNDLQRPVNWEDQMFISFAESGLKGLYLLPDGGVADTDISDRVVIPPCKKKELF